MARLRVKKGDQVIIIAGRDRGKFGEVLRVLPKESRVIVQGVNLVKKHQRQSHGQDSGIFEKEAPLHISNVAHIDPKTNGPTRIGFKVLENGQKVRFALRSGEVIDRTV